jgi:hypothetical protein
MPATEKLKQRATALWRDTTGLILPYGRGRSSCAAPAGPYSVGIFPAENLCSSRSGCISG